VPPTRPIIALITDFGDADHYVGAMKGAILNVCPEVEIVDIVHSLEAHDIEGGAWCLAASFRAFPEGSVFVAVVDPDVGGKRRGVAIEAAGYRFVGPDNGIFTYVLHETGDFKMHEITNRALMRAQVSSTFHGRDVFGPVAGYLAKGTPLWQVGPAAQDPVMFGIQSMRQKGPGEWEATIVHVDRFGNLTTSLYERDLTAMLAEAGGDPTEVVVVVEGAVIPLVQAYSDVAEGEACALVGSTGRLEIAVHRDNAARRLGAGKGAPIRVRLVRTSGY
jgi:S-adenosyl-L-methionine hydrolase (adenosine-forming)